MKINKVLALAIMLIISVLYPTSALAAGSVYFTERWGSNFEGCGGISVPCRSYSYAYKRAESLSITQGGGYKIYDLASGTSVAYGYVDRTGGSGSEPGDSVPPVPYEYGGILWPSLGTLLVGFVLGRLFLRNRQKPTEAI